MSAIQAILSPNDNRWIPLDSMSVHNSVGYSIEKIRVRLRDWGRNDFFTLSYIFGNVLEINNLELYGDDARRTKKVLVLMHRHKARCRVQCLRLFGLADWTQDAAVAINIAILDDTQHCVKRLEIVSNRWDLSGINLSNLQEFSLHDHSELATEAVSIALGNPACRLTCLHMPFASTGVDSQDDRLYSIFCENLSQLESLENLALSFQRCSPDNLLLLSSSIPSSVRHLSIGCDEDMDIHILGPGVTHVTHLKITLMSLREPQTQNSVAMFLTHCRCVQDLTITCRLLSKPSVPILQTLTSWSSLQRLSFVSLAAFRMDESCLDLVATIFNNNPHLVQFDAPQSRIVLADNRSINSYTNHFEYLMYKNQIRYKKILETTFAPGEWPFVVVKAMACPSTLFELLKEKSDGFIPHGPGI